MDATPVHRMLTHGNCGPRCDNAPNGSASKLNPYTHSRKGYPRVCSSCSSSSSAYAPAVDCSRGKVADAANATMGCQG